MDKLWQVAMDFWMVLLQMAPYLLFGFLMAGLLSVLIPQRLVERHLSGRGLMPVVKSAILGVPMPLCSCGVIPVSAGLKRHGASKAATTAFLISTPQTGADNIAVVYSLLGGVFAVFSPIFAFASGLVGGILVDLFTHDEHVPAARLPACQEACCDPNNGKSIGRRIRHVFEYGFVTLPRDIGKALLVGLVIAALISALVPKDLFARVLHGEMLSILVMMAVGIPIYVCSSASVPIAAALILGGVAPGAAFAFLVTGPATNAATVAMVWKVMGRKTAVIYLATIAGMAVAGGLILNRIVDVAAIQQRHHHMAEMGPSPVAIVSAVVLLGVLAFAVLRPAWRRAKPEGQGEAPEGHGHGQAGHEPHPGPEVQTAALEIAGMTCSHCADGVRRALSECPGVSAARVDLQAGKATVEGTALDADQLRQAVESLGYTVRAATLS